MPDREAEKESGSAAELHSGTNGVFKLRPVAATATGGPVLAAVPPATTQGALDLSERQTASARPVSKPVPGNEPRRPLLKLQGVRRLLCIGAHCKDIEVGAGGTIAYLIEGSPGIEVWWAVFGCEVPTRAREARRAAKMFLRGAAKTKVFIHGFRDGYMPFQGDQVRETFEELHRSFQPDLILTHRGDGHLDHRLINEFTRDTWVHQNILEYEIFTGRSGLRCPNVYVPLAEDAARTKISRLLNAYSSRTDQPSFSEDVFWSLMRLRGAECGAPTSLAEAFHMHRLIGT